MTTLAKVVLVTGSSRGIGEAIAIAFAKQGASLSITGHKEKLAAAAQKCRESGAKQVLETIADVKKMEDLNRLMDCTIQTFGRLDVLVNNAGILHMEVDGIEGAYTNEKFDNMFGTNVKAPMYLTKIAKTHLIATKGNIVNISSTAPEYPVLSLVLYGMTKSCINYLTKTTAAGFAKDGVRCNAICPGVIHTDIFNNLLPQQKIDAMLQAQLNLNGRIPIVEDVANLATFLASDNASMITGECVTLDGGVLVGLANK